ARSCADCSASCIFCVNLSMRMLQDSERDRVGNWPIKQESFPARRFKGQAFDTNASPTMSLCDEHGRKMDWTQSAGAFAAGCLPTLYRRLGDFRHWHVDASNGARMGHEHAHQQGDPPRDGEFC